MSRLLKGSGYVVSCVVIVTWLPALMYSYDNPAQQIIFLRTQVFKTEQILAPI